MEAANQALFDDPKEHQRLKAIASGFSKSGIRGGIAFVIEDKVRTGETIYRIGHSNLPMTIKMSSPWWMRDAAFAHIMGSADAAGSDPRDLYRMKCAVSYDFGVADIVLKARVKQPSVRSPGAAVRWWTTARTSTGRCGSARRRSPSFSSPASAISSVASPRRSATPPSRSSRSSR